MLLQLTHITYTYPGASDPALSDVTATFGPGWTGVVGDNGGGKTTLTLVAAGLIRPDEGTVAPASPASAVCPQDALLPPENLADFACAYDGLALRLRRELRIEDDWPWRYDTLSGGQRKRLQVACALWARPDVLVVDEPTNYVDAPTRRALAAALAAFDGVGLLVSHDRALLDELCTRCLFVHAGRATMRSGTYSQAAGQAEAERASVQHARDCARREARRVRAEAQRRREEASRVAGRRSARGLAPGDHDARARIGLYVVSGQDGKAGRLSARMDERLRRADERLDALRVERRYEADVWLDATPSGRPVLLRADEALVPLGTDDPDAPGGPCRTSLRVPPLSIGNTEHVALVGDNGSGKTTLVRRVVAALRDAGVRTLYLPQELTRAQEATALRELDELGDARRGQALSFVAQLNSDPARLVQGGAVSPGELRKLMLAIGAQGEPEAIVMDEPTNHLDLGSVEALQRVLAGYPGALLLVTHDVSLARATADVVWSIEPAGDGYELRVR